jgi:putative oxidoreductase
MRGYTLLIIRVVVGLIFLLHGWPKLAEPSGAMGFFSNLGLPSFLAPIVGVVEVGAGLMLLFGLFARPAAAALLVIIAGALILVQIPAGIQPGFERDWLIAASLLLLIAHGPGAFALRRTPRAPKPD